MWTKFAAVAVLPFSIAIAAPAHAVPNHAVFLQAIAGDGIVMDSQAALIEAYAVCKSMQVPDGASLWDTAQQLKSVHPEWSIDSALDFANRSIQNICPDKGTF